MKRLDTEVEDHISDLFEEYARSEKRSKRAQLAWLVEEALKKTGFLQENNRRGGEESTERM